MRTRSLFASAALLLSGSAVGCGGGHTEAPAVPLPTAPEPAVSPPAAALLPGRVMSLAGGPEGVVITSSGLVAVNVRNPDGLVVLPLSSFGSPDAVRFIPLGGSARHLTLAGPDGPALVAQETTDQLVEVSPADGKVVSRTAVGRQPHEAFQVGGTQWVANEFGDSFSIVTDARVTATVPAPLQPGGGAVSSDGRFVVGVGVRARRMSQYTPTGSVIGTANCGAGPTHVVAGDGDTFWVADTNGGAVLGFVPTPTGPKQVADIGLGAGSKPYGIAYDGVHHVLLVTLTGRNQLLELTVEGSSVTRRKSQDTVQQPNTVAVDPASGQIVVTGSTAAGHLQLLAE